MRRIVRMETQGPEDLSLLEGLGRDYKAFKKQNPEKTARVPLEMKQKAKDVLDGGTSLKTLSEAMGLTPPSILRWMQTLSKNSSAQKKVKPHIALSLKAPTEAPKPEPKPTEEASAQMSTPTDWIKIRINGREIEIAKADFWEFLQGEGGRPQ